MVKEEIWQGNGFWYLKGWWSRECWESIKAFRNFKMYLYDLIKDVEQYNMAVNL